MTRSILLMLTALLSTAPALARAGNWADEDYDGGEEEPDARELLAHIHRADTLAKAPTIPLMLSGLFFGGPIALAAGSGDTVQGLNFSAGGGVLLASSLGTSIGGALISNLVGGDANSWGLFVAGAVTSSAGVFLYEASIGSFIGGSALGGGDFRLIAPGVIAGASSVIVGEILTMVSSGAVEDRFEAKVGQARGRPMPTLALAPAPMGQGFGLVAAGTW